MVVFHKWTAIWHKKTSMSLWVTHIVSLQHLLYTKNRVVGRQGDVPFCGEPIFYQQPLWLSKKRGFGGWKVAVVVNEWWKPPQASVVWLLGLVGGLGDCLVDKRPDKIGWYSLIGSQLRFYERRPLALSTCPIYIYICTYIYIYKYTH